MYRAPIDDIRFALEEIAVMDGLKTTGAFPDLSSDLTRQVMEEAARFAEEVFGPLDRGGDTQGCTLKDGAVTTPKGFCEAYAKFVEAGWQGISAPAGHGGMGLPRALGGALGEMINGANMALSLAPLLTASAIEALTAHGSDAQKALYLPKLVTGEWSGAMNLTEPQAGSDLGAATTRAEPAGDGVYRLTGQKIFITWGEHDCAANIVHLVLARTPDAPAGSKGLSLFLAPKFLPDADGKPGERNALKAIGLEEKLGIHGSPTCVMEFAGATAWLVGEENRGLAQMFTMMNAARLQVGLQGVGVGARAYSRALDYANERKQGTGPDGEYPAPIVEHADVRRMLTLMKAKIEAARHICFATAVAADAAAFEESEEDRAFARRREQFLTPIAKAWGSDVGLEAASLGLQIHGGAGFIEETGAAQHYRDARIAPIYEGTNGIQAMDLVGRKLSLDDGLAIDDLMEEMEATLEDCATSSNAELPEIAKRLEPALRALEDASDWLLDEDRDDEERMAAAYPYLTLCGEVIGGYFLAVGAVAGQRRLKDKDGDAEFARGKIALARYYAESVLPLAPARAAEVTGAAEPLLDAPEIMLEA